MFVVMIEKFGVFGSSQRRGTYTLLSYEQVVFIFNFRQLSCFVNTESMCRQFFTKSKKSFLNMPCSVNASYLETRFIIKDDEVLVSIKSVYFGVGGRAR